MVKYGPEYHFDREIWSIMVRSILLLASMVRDLKNVWNTTVVL